MLISVQYARAVAALLVVTGHVSGFSAFQAASTTHFGGVGVDIFFVISGFIMWETSKDQSPADFLRRRIARIVPPYWFYTTLLVLLALAAPAFTPNIELSTKALLGSYFFIPYTDHRGLMNPILLQGWTLNLEMYFYFVFAFSLFLSDRRARFLGVSAFFAIAILIGLFVDSSWAAVSRFTSTILLEFVMGMAVSAIWLRWRISFSAALAILLLSVAALFYAEIRMQNSGINFIVFGIPAAFFLLGLLNMETSLAKRPLPWLVATGDASYSLYLAHPFILSAVHIIFQRWLQNYLGSDSMVLAITFALTAIITSVIFSYLSYMLLEKPAGRFVLKQLSGGRNIERKRKMATV